MDSTWGPENTSCVAFALTIEVAGECELDYSGFGWSTMTRACEHGTEQTAAILYVTLCSVVDGYVPAFRRNVHRGLHLLDRIIYCSKARIVVS
jgi:hypothetical protein